MTEENKNIVNTENGKYKVIPIKTKVFHVNDSLYDILSFIDKKEISENDIVVLSEKVLSIIQKRVVHKNDVKVSKVAKVLSTKVSNTPGSNLTDPSTMQMAINEAGYYKILLAATVSALTKPFGKKGLFYVVAGDKVRGIDAPDINSVPPYNEYISLSPTNPDYVAKKIGEVLGCKAVVIDANYRGVNIIGVSDLNMDKNLYKQIFKNNQLGQMREMTPIAIVKKLN